MGGVLSASPLEVGIGLGLESARHSSAASYSLSFRALRAAEESRPLSFVAIYRDGTAGPNDLSYPFLRHFHPTAMEFLLSFFNWIYTSELFPEL